MRLQSIDVRNSGPIKLLKATDLTDVVVSQALTASEIGEVAQVHGFRGCCASRIS